MKLQEYLERERITNILFADMLGVHPNYVGMLLNGKRKPSLDLARMIEDVTDKQVTLDDLIERKTYPRCCTKCGQRIPNETKRYLRARKNIGDIQ